MGDTICAISTARGEAGIGIVRISGEKSLEIMRGLFLGCPEEVVPRHAYFGKVVAGAGRKQSDSQVSAANGTSEQAQVIDEALFLFMQGPASYTGEDILEVQAHGSDVALKEILRQAMRLGARAAEAGEFTKLAFLNGKLDLSQAEAVIDIIKAKTDWSLDIAEKQKAGRLSTAVQAVRSNLLDILAQMAVNIDYPDEDIEQESYEGYIEDLRFALADVQEMLSTASIGRIARDGIRVAIVGKPNVGKSSLMNALLGEGRVIVTDVPGTTRDTVEEIANIDGVPMTLIDTAGIRETDDVVEKLGIERTRDALVKADMAVVVLDGSCELDEEDEAVLDLLARGVGGTGAGVGGTGASIGMPSDRIIVVLNKKDQGSILAEKQIAEKLPKAKILRTSLVGLGVLEGAALVSDAISETYNIKGAVNRERTIVTSERHIAALESAADNLEQAIYLLEEGEALEITELNVHYAYDELGSITGETASDEILDTVFSKFCLGK